MKHCTIQYSFEKREKLEILRDKSKNHRHTGAPLIQQKITAESYQIPQRFHKISHLHTVLLARERGCRAKWFGNGWSETIKRVIQLLENVYCFQA